MIERYTKPQITDFLNHHEDPFVFAALPSGEWGVGKSTGGLTRSGQVSFMHAWDIDPPGDLLRVFGNGERGYYTDHRNVIAMFAESDFDKAKEFLEEMKRIDTEYFEQCKAPLLKKMTRIAVLQARMNP